MVVSTPIADWAVAAAILFSLSATVVVLRALAINARKTGLKAPDYFIFLSLFCQIGYIIDVSILGV